MELTILGASGATGRELVQQALARGHRVIAVARDPAKIAGPETAMLKKITADVRDPASLAAAIGPHSVVLSALGVTDVPGVLHAGAQALVTLKPARILWMGAFGAGASAEAAGWATRTLLSLMGDRLKDKVAGDTQILSAGGVIFHAGPLSNGPASGSRRTVALVQAPRQFFPSRVSRATVAAAMLDEAEQARFPGGIVIPLER
jgi:putative NADH-flavin reductase